MVELILELVNSILKHGVTWAAAGTIVVALYRHRLTILKILHRGKVQETQLDQIQRDIRGIKEHLGVVECAERKDLSLNLEKHLLKLSIKERLSVRSVDAFTLKGSTTYLRRNNQMKAYLNKLSSTKLQALIVATFMNVALLVGYVMNVQDIQSKVDAWMPMANMIVQTVLTIAYQWARASVDKAEIKSTDSFDDTKTH